MEESSGSYRLSCACTYYTDCDMRILLSSTNEMVPAACAACPAGYAWADGSSICIMTFSLPLLVLNSLQILVFFLWVVWRIDNKHLFWNPNHCSRCSQRCDREITTKATAVVHALHVASMFLGLVLSAIVVSRALEREPYDSTQQPSPRDVDLAALFLFLIGVLRTVAITVFRKQLFKWIICCSCLMKNAWTSKVMDIECMCETCRCRLRKHEEEKAARARDESRDLQEQAAALEAAGLEEEARVKRAHPKPEARNPKPETQTPNSKNRKQKTENRKQNRQTRNQEGRKKHGSARRPRFKRLCFARSTS